MVCKALVPFAPLIAFALAGAVVRAQPSPVVTSTPPTIFAPGVISGPAHDASPAFTPDGQTVFFSRSNTAVSTVLVSHRQNAGWSEPTVASFSGEWDDMEPTMAPDGSYLLFISNRPPRAGDKLADGFYNGQSWPKGGTAIWRVDRSGSGWSVPHVLPAIINSGPTIFAPSVAADGSVYFMKPDGPKAKFRIFRAQLRTGAFETPVALPFSTGTDTDVDPAVAPDESFIVFGSGRAPALTSIDLFICFRRDGIWDTPVHMGNVVNSPGSDAEARLGPDHRTLYFSSERVVPVTFPETTRVREQELKDMTAWNNSLYNIWSVSLEPWLKESSHEREPLTAPLRP